MKHSDEMKVALNDCCLFESITLIIRLQTLIMQSILLIIVVNVGTCERTL